MREITAYVALGSNLGDRAAQLDAAVEALARSEGVRLVCQAPRIETCPVGGPPQADYLNGAVCIATRLAPGELLARLHAIEADAGRRRGPERNLPRTLDLDLLLYGDQVIDSAQLQVPHPRLAERSFVLDPLCEIARHVIHPLLGVSIGELARRARERSADAGTGESAPAAEPSWPS